MQPTIASRTLYVVNYCGDLLHDMVCLRLGALDKHCVLLGLGQKALHKLAVSTSTPLVHAAH